MELRREPAHARCPLTNVTGRGEFFGRVRIELEEVRSPGVEERVMSAEPEWRFGKSAGRVAP
jgi:hypothetical protein